MTEPGGPDHSHETDTSFAARASKALRLLRPMGVAIDRAHKTLDLLCAFGSIGVVLIVIGLLRMGLQGAWAFVPVFVGVVAAVPVFCCWQGRRALDRLRQLPERLRAAGFGPTMLVEEATAAFSDTSAWSKAGLRESVVGLRTALSETLTQATLFEDASPPPSNLLSRVLIGSPLCVMVFAGGLVVFLISVGT